MFSNSSRLSELLYLPLPALPTASQKSDSILIGLNTTLSSGDADELITTGGKWEDEEERRFFEDIQDLKDFVPSSVLGIEEEPVDEDSKEVERERTEKEREEVRKLEEELERLNDPGAQLSVNEEKIEESLDEEYEIFFTHAELSIQFLNSIPTPTPGTPRANTPPLSPQMAPQGPSQLLTALLVRLPDATNRVLIDQAAIDFAFLNSKAARKRLIRVRQTSYSIQPKLIVSHSSCLKSRKAELIFYLTTRDSLLP